jgi:hypothetical protein
MKKDITHWLVENGLNQPFEALVTGLVIGLVLGYLIAK